MAQWDTWARALCWERLRGTSAGPDDTSALDAKDGAGEARGGWATVPGLTPALSRRSSRVPHRVSRRWWSARGAMARRRRSLPHTLP